MHVARQGFPGGSDGKESIGNAGDPVVVKNMPPNAGDTRDVSSIPALGRKIPWSRKWQTTPAFFSRKLYGQRSLEGYSPWGREESDMTQQLSSVPCVIQQVLVGYLY